MDERDYVLEIECDEPEGKVLRRVRLCQLSMAKLREIYDRLKGFDVIFNDMVRGGFEEFVGMLFDIDQEHSSLVPSGLVWEVDDVGILFLTEIRPAFEAQAHFVFWDRRFRGRRELCQAMTKHVMEEFKLHRIFAEVPAYASNTAAFVRGLGFKPEGRKRSSVKYKGQWFDVKLFAVIEGEL